MGLINFTFNNDSEHYYSGKSCSIEFAQGGSNGSTGGPILLDLMFVHDNVLFGWWLQKSEGTGIITVLDERYGYKRTIEFKQGFCTAYKEYHEQEEKDEVRSSGPGLISITIEAKTFIVEGDQFPL
jgi:hypothetical protein